MDSEISVPGFDPFRDVYPINVAGGDGGGPGNVGLREAFLLEWRCNRQIALGYATG